MGNLEFIKSASGSSVSSLSVTDCFSADYDVYLTIVEVSNVSATFNNISYRYRNSSGDVSTTTYDYAHIDLTAYTAFSEGRATNSTGLLAVQFADDVQGDVSEGIAYHFNPYDSSSYTFCTNQNNGQSSSGMFGRKGIGVEKTAQQITGITVSSYAGGETGDFNIKVYGLASN